MSLTPGLVAGGIVGVDEVVQIRAPVFDNPTHFNEGQIITARAFPYREGLLGDTVFSSGLAGKQFDVGCNDQ